jgi:MFS family permease
MTVAALILAAGTALFVLDPPVHSDDARLPAAARSAPGAPAGAGASWLTTPVAGLLLVTVAATFTVAGTDTALTAVMTDFGRVDRLGLVFAIWCLASLVGGFVFGASGRRLEPVLVLAALAALCLPVALAGTWQALALLVVPTGLFCAPVMSLTAEVLTGCTPPGARGLVLGVHSSALTVGNALGAPVTGLVVDAVDPRLGFVAIGALGLVLAGLARAVGRSGAGSGARSAAPEPVTGGQPVVVGAGQ